MQKGLSDSRLAKISAKAIYQSWVEFRSVDFEITHGAALRFEYRDWHELLRDAVVCLKLYKKIIDRKLEHLRALLSGRSLLTGILTCLRT